MVKAIGRIFAGCFFLFAVTLIVAADSRNLPAIEFTDYGQGFYLGGYMLRTGHAQELYPEPGLAHLKDARVNVFAHELLHTLEPQVRSIFLYPAVVAAAIAPFTVLDVRTSLAAWQLTSLASLALFSWIVARQKRLGFWTFFLSTALFFPLIQIFIIGQTTVAFGLLPLAAGWLAWRQDRRLTAGALWSLLWLKPQLLPVVAITIGADCLTIMLDDEAGEIMERMRRAAPILCGFIAGSAAIAVISSALVPPDGFLKWLRCLTLYSREVVDPLHSLHQMVSASGLLTMRAPEQAKTVLRPVGTLLGVFVCAFELLIASSVLRHARRSKAGRDVTMLLAVFCLPLAVPYLRLYDLSAYLLPFSIIASGESIPENARARLRAVALACLIAANVYVAAVMASASAEPTKLLQLVLVSIYSGAWLYTSWLAPKAVDAFRESAGT